MKKSIIVVFIFIISTSAFAQVGKHSLNLKNYITVGILEYEYVALQSRHYQISASVGAGGYVRRLFPKIKDDFSKFLDLPNAKVSVPALYASLNAHMRLQNHKDNYVSVGLFFNYRNEAHVYGTIDQWYEYLREDGYTYGFRVAYAHRSAKGLQWSAGVTPFGVTSFKPIYVTQGRFLGFPIFNYTPQHLLEYKGRHENYLEDSEKFYDAVSGNPPRVISKWSFLFPYPEFSVGWRF